MRLIERWKVGEEGEYDPATARNRTKPFYGIDMSDPTPSPSSESLQSQRAAEHSPAAVRWSFWIVLGAAVFAFGYSALRVVQGQRAGYLPMQFTSDLMLRQGDRFGLAARSAAQGAELRLARVNGSPVKQSKDLQPLFAEKREAAELVFETVGQPGRETRLFWGLYPNQPQVMTDGTLALHPAAKAELGLSGDMVMTSFFGRPISDPGWLVLAFAERWSTIQVGLSPADAKADPSGEILYGWSVIDERQPWLLLLIAVMFGGLGVGIFRFMPGSRSAWSYYLFCSFVAAFYSIRSIPSSYRSPWEAEAMMILQCGCYFPFLYFLNSFSPLRKLNIRFGWIVLGVLIFDAVLFTLWQMRLYSPFMVLWGMSVLLIVLVALPAEYLLRWRGVGVDPVDRQRGLVIRFALGAAFGPVALHAIFRNHLGAGAATLEFIATAFPLLFPLIIGTAILRYNLLAADELALEGLAYGVFATAAAGGYALLTGLLIPFVTRTLPVSSTALTAATVCLAAFFAYPLLSWARARLDAVYGRANSRYDDFADSIKSEAPGFTSRELFAQYVVNRVSRITEAPNVTLLAGAGGLHPIASTLPEISNLREDNSWDGIEKWLMHGGGPVSRENLRDALGAETPDTNAAKLFDRLEACWLIPLIIDQRLEGVFAIGEKLRSRNFTRTELRKLMHLVRECAVGLYSFTARRQREEKLQAESALRRSEEQLRLLAQNAMDVIYRHSLEPSPGMDYISPAIRVLTGHGPEEFEDDPELFDRLLHPDDRSKVEEVLASGERQPVVQVRWRRRDDSILWVEQRLAPVRDADGRIIAIEGIARDVTERVRADQERVLLEGQLRQSQKLEAMGTLAAGVAHDFGNLITAIFAFTRLARTALPEDHPATSSLHHVESAALQANGITRSLLAFTHGSPAERLPVNLSRILREAGQFLSRVLSSSIRLGVVPTEGEDVWVLGDESQINQILMNLVINARDAMPDGGNLRLGVERRPDDPEWAWISVEDNGCGMTEEVRLRVFEPFYTTKARGQGTGLGLAVTHGIVMDHGGKIQIHSVPRKGTRFEIALPACAPQSANATDTAVGARLDGGGSRLLLVEDEPLVRSAVATRLRELSFDVVQASDGIEAMEVFNRESESLSFILLDIDLPRKSGAACLREIKEAGFEGRILVMTGNPEFEVDGGEASTIVLLRKPFTIDELTDQLRKLLQITPNERPVR